MANRSSVSDGNPYFQPTYIAWLERHIATRSRLVNHITTIAPVPSFTNNDQTKNSRTSEQTSLVVRFRVMSILRHTQLNGKRWPLNQHPSARYGPSEPVRYHLQFQNESENPPKRDVTSLWWCDCDHSHPLGHDLKMMLFNKWPAEPSGYKNEYILLLFLPGGNRLLSHHIFFNFRNDENTTCSVRGKDQRTVPER